MRIILLIAALFFSAFAAAETIPSIGASGLQDAWYTDFDANSGTTYKGQTCAGVAAFFKARMVSSGSPWDSCSCVGKDLISCHDSRGWDVGPYAAARYCPPGTTAAGVNQCTTVPSCPDGGYTLSADKQTCSRPDCPSGEFRDAAGVCHKDCTSKLGQPLPSPSYEFVNDGGTPTVSGCEVRCNTWAAPKGSTALLPSYQVGSNCNFTGHPPTGDGTEGTGFKPAPDAPKKPSDCTGSGMGYVQTSSGTTCVPASSGGDSAPVVNDKKSSVTGPPGPDGNPISNSPDTTTTTTDTKTDPATGNTTKTTTTSSPAASDSNGVKTCPAGMVLNGDICQKVTSTTTDTGSFCQQNPTAPACGGNQNSDACSEHPDRASCASFGDPGASDSSALPSKDVGVSSISPVSLNTDMTCPTGAPMPFGIGTFPMDGICMFASGIRPIIIVMAWVAAALIVIGAFRGDS